MTRLIIFLALVTFMTVCGCRVQAQTDSTNFYFSVGYDYYSKYKLDEAIKFFDISIQKKYLLAYSYAYKAGCKFMRLDISGGKLDLDTAFFYDSLNSQVFYFRGVQYKHMQKFDSTVFYAKKAIQLDPNDEVNYDLVASGFHGLALFDSAKKYINKAIQLKPFNTTYLNNLGSIELDAGEVENALIRFQICLKKNPNDIIAKLNIAECKYKLKQFDEAIRICTSVMNLDPAYPRPYYLRGQIYFTIGDKEKACSDFRKLGTYEDMEKLSTIQLEKCKCN